MGDKHTPISSKCTKRNQRNCGNCNGTNDLKIDNSKDESDSNADTIFNNIKIISLNIRKGLGSTAKEHEIRDLIDTHKAQLIFLNEIDMRKEEGEEFRMENYKTFLPKTEKKCKIRSLVLVKVDILGRIIIRNDLQISDVPIIVCELISTK